ncbi:MAG TPA: DedA family protein [Thermoplasmata archaeon]|nr:DedA family protein [Thermoplasmata archaeon]
MRSIFSFVGWLFDLILTILRTIGLPGLFALMVVESFGIPPLPSEVILPFSGVLIVMGANGFTWPSVIVVAVAGGLVGAVIAYEVGRWGGRGLIRRWGAKLRLGDDDLRRAEEFFDRRGEATVFVARLVPLARAYISYPAGAAEMNRGRFALFTVLGATPFAVALVYLGVLLGKNYTVLESYFNLLDVVVVVVGIAIVVWYVVQRRKVADVPVPGP